MNKNIIIGVGAVVLVAAGSYLVWGFERPPEETYPEYKSPLTEMAERAAMNDEVEATMSDESSPNNDIVDAVVAAESSLGLRTEISFAHVAPGEYSEVYLLVYGEPDQEVTRYLEGPGLVSPSAQTLRTDEKGMARFVWRINRYGFYEAKESVWVENPNVEDGFGGMSGGEYKKEVVADVVVN